MTYVLLPKYDKAQDRIATTHADIKDAVDQLARNLKDYSTRHLHLGWALDDDSWNFTVEGERVMGKVDMTRED
jgi:hypothetical protein